MSVQADGMSAADAFARARATFDARDDAWQTVLDGRIHVSRQVRPAWAVLVAIVLFPLGLLALLVRRVEAAEVIVVDGPRGAQFTITGELTPYVTELLEDGLRSPPPAAPAPPPTPTASQQPPAGTAPTAVADATVTRGSGTPAGSIGQMVRRLVLPGGEPLDLPARGRVVLGRNPHVDDAGDVAVALDDPGMSVSKTHAAVTVDPDGVTVEDLHSTNGTTLSVDGQQGERLVPGVPGAVASGTHIHLGDVRVTYVDQEGHLSR